MSLKDNLMKKGVMPRVSILYWGGGMEKGGGVGSVLKHLWWKSLLFIILD